MALLLSYLPEGAPARVTSPGEIEIAPKLLLDPDILIWPSSHRLGTPWTAISDWWLAVEVSGRASRVYDREFKRDAYLALGVREVWLVDLHDRRVLVSHRDGLKDVPHQDKLLWQPSGMPSLPAIDLRTIFAGLS
jgi:hypothetical protein